MTPCERLALWSGVGFLICTLVAWATDCSPLRCLAWGLMGAIGFGLPVILRCAVEASHRRALSREEIAWRSRSISPTRGRCGWDRADDAEVYPHVPVKAFIDRDED